jgi:hypothetical protein
MGDRVLVLFTDDSKELSPAIYMHWGGDSAARFITEAQPLLRHGDASYAAARFCGFCHDAHRSALGLGLLNAPTEKNPDWEKFSHGDAGVYVVNVSTGFVLAYGGYGVGFKLDPANFAHG